MRSLLLILLLFGPLAMAQKESSVFSYLDVFELEYASDPQVSPDDQWLLYRRNGFDIMTDKSVSKLWLMNLNTKSAVPLTGGELNEFSGQWSPQGDRIAFVKSTEDGSEIFMYWIHEKRSMRITQLPQSPSSLTWSPDGKKLYFSMMVPSKAPSLIQMPPKPDGAVWAEPARITDRLKHESDGSGYIKPGFKQLFSIPADGGSIEQLTFGNFQHQGVLSPDPSGNYLYFSGNLSENAEYDYVNSEVYRLTLRDGTIDTLTSRKGPDEQPQVSPDGKWLVYLGFDDKVQAYQRNRMYLRNLSSGETKELQKDLDRDITQVQWDNKSNGLYFAYDEFGKTKIAYTSLQDSRKDLISNMGGTSLGRPYAGGDYDITSKGNIVYTKGRTDRPADLYYSQSKKGEEEALTSLNEDLLFEKQLGVVEEVWYTSSVDGRDLQGWIVKPPHYEEGKSYPLLVENHGGPILNYGERFSAEIQLYAAAGYLVFYPNPRGSTGYGEAFGNLLYHNYPGEDYNDVMDGVDLLIEKGLTTEDQLFVTGGSAGGIMTAWMIGKNNRFEAAVVAKPVVNWISKTLVADNYYGYAHYRLPGQPWENPMEYWKFSPLSLVGNIQTPTMVMVGMNDLRTPPSEAKQLYHALKMRKIETVLVEIPGASHGIANKPSNLISKIAHTLAWFEKYKE